MMDRREMLLIQLMEEAGEVVQASSKVLRFGTNHTWPVDGEKLAKTAESRLTQELIDLLALVELCQFEGFLSPWPLDIRERIDAKKLKVAKYMELSIELGKVS